MNSVFKNKTARRILNKVREIKVLFPKRIKYFLKLMRGDFKGDRQSKPVTIQLPITYKCNFDCVMCGMRTMINKKDISIGDLERILANPLFSDIENVGLNGESHFCSKISLNMLESCYINCRSLKTCMLFLMVISLISF